MDSTVLCIDDRPQVLDLRKATLESHGYRVKIASSGYTAMKILEERSAVAVLLEYKQEGMDGEALACLIKQRFPNLPIILLSAYSEMPERILWLVDAYVMKSELPERLVPIIERACRRAPRSEEGRPGLLKGRPDVYLPYVILREHVIDRLYDQNVGYWQPNLQGLDHLTRADHPELLVDYLSVSERQFVKAVERLAADGKYELAASLLESSGDRLRCRPVRHPVHQGDS